MIRPLTADDLASLLANLPPESGVPGGRLFLFDVRSAEEYLAGHISGARHLPDHYAERWIPQRCHTQDQIVFIDAAGAPAGPARHLAAKMTHHWFRCLRFLEGGIPAWISAGKPLIFGGAAGPGAASHDGIEPAFKTSSPVAWRTP